jgi:hypothetical protein
MFVGITAPDGTHARVNFSKKVFNKMMEEESNDN